ncbi:MAG TPA: hypothetical protein VFV10_01110 [Gammaproteobacteria bacterium]|nr:hypothetical protein [Gammaproteobacteria bacterium]
MKGLCAICVVCLGCMHAAEGGVRDHTRPAEQAGATSISESQSSELTLTLTETAMRRLQTWVRTAGKLGEDGRTVSVFVRPPDAELLAVGERARAFPVTYRTQVRQGYVTKIAKEDGGVRVEVTLQDDKHSDDSRYLVEIVHEQDPLLTIPNVSIIEDGDAHVVYVQSTPGEYTRREIQIGRQGEMYTEVLDGLDEGDQVVSIGSFFVDAEHKLNNDMPAGAMPGMDHGAMPGMDHSAMPNMDHGAMPGMDHGASSPPQKEQ